jgi:hypothetical protein
MVTYNVITNIASELLLKPAPEFLTFSINLWDRLFILRIGPPHLHPDSHDRPGKGPTERSFPAYPSAKSAGQFRDKGALNPEILLETQGDRFSSIKPLFKIILSLLSDLFGIVLLFQFLLLWFFLKKI